MKPAKTESKVAEFSSYVIAGILLMLPFQALLTTWLGSNTGHLDLIRIWKEIVMVGLALPAIYLLVKLPSLRKIFLAEPLLWLFAFYILLHLVLGAYALTHSRVNASAFIYALIINLRFIYFFLLCYVFVAQIDLLKRNWVKLLLIPAGLVVIFGLLQQFVLPYDFLRHFGYGPNTIPAYQTVDSDINYQRIQSTLRGANPLGAYLVLIIPAILAVTRKKNRYIFAAATLAVLFFSYSRSAWIGLFMALAIIVGFRLGFSGKTKKLLVVAVGVLVLLGLGVYSLRTNHTAENTIFHTNTISMTGSPNVKHLDSIKSGISDTAHQPQGRGPGTAGPASFRNTGYPPRIAEDYYLQLGQEVGLLGMATFLAMTLLVGLRLWAIRAQALPQVLLASLIGISFINLVSHAWTDDTLALIWWGLAGVALAPDILINKRKSNKNAQA